jgi:hypothetical protein
VDLSQAREAFRVDPDGTGIQLSWLVQDGQPLSFSVTDMALSSVISPKGLWVQAPGTAVADWKDSLHPTYGGRPLDLQDHETSRTLAWLPKASGFLLGTDWWIRSFDSKGVERWRMPVPAAVWGMGLGAEGRVCVAMLADGSFRWHRTSDSKPLFTLFVAPDGRWVLWTPSGYAGGQVSEWALVSLHGIPPTPPPKAFSKGLRRLGTRPSPKT